MLGTTSHYYETCVNSYIEEVWESLHSSYPLTSSERMTRICFQGVSIHDVHLLMPGVECPGTWRELFQVSIVKMQWLRDIESRLNGHFGMTFLSILQSYSLYWSLQSSSTRTATERFFSSNDVYLFQLHQSLGAFDVLHPPRLTAECVEEMLSQTFSSSSRTLSSGNVLIIRKCACSLLPASTSSSSSSSRYLLSTIYPLSSSSYVSYADIFEAFLLPSGSSPSPQLPSSFEFQIPSETSSSSPTSAMPYEIYVYALSSP